MKYFIVVNDTDASISFVETEDKAVVDAMCLETNLGYTSDTTREELEEVIYFDKSVVFYTVEEHIIHIDNSIRFFKDENDDEMVKHYEGLKEIYLLLDLCEYDMHKGICDICGDITEVITINNKTICEFCHN